MDTLTTGMLDPPPHERNCEEPGRRKHVLKWAGGLAWCRVCGSYAEAKARGLGVACKGAPKRKGLRDYGGMWGQLQKLKAGKHPKTGVPLLRDDMQASQSDDGHGTYRNLEAAVQRRRGQEIPVTTDSMFKPYVPAPARVMVARTGKTAATLHAERLERIQKRANDSLG